MPRKQQKQQDIVDKLKDILNNLQEINSLEDQLNQEKLLVSQELQKCIIDIKNNIISKL